MIKFVVLIVTIVVAGCSGPGSPTTNTPTYGSVVSGPNVVAISMGCGYLNEPCVSVTICQPGTSNCQTISNVLLDTGSYGLRLFGSVINVNLTPVNASNSNPIAECTTYGDGTSQWGPIRIADVQLGSNKASNVPIQVVDSTYSNPPNSCTNLDTSPADDHYNGILGVGLHTQDCGANCVSSANNGIYYSCASSTCTGAAVPLASQVTNPVGMFGSDNNGVVVQLPSLPGDGAYNIVGSLILGIGTQSNNTPGSVTTLSANSSAEFSTNFGGRSYAAFIDSGSNSYSFPSTSVTNCDANSVYYQFYCPSGDISLSATQVAAAGGATATVNFVVGNAGTIFSAGLHGSPTIAGPASGYFDWGLPFFYGKTVYVGITGKTSPLGTGPYWAF